MTKQDGEGLEREQASDPSTTTGTGTRPKFKASLQRGAPKPRRMPPKPQCIAGITNPWASERLELTIDNGQQQQQSKPIQLSIRQWTGMSFPSESADDTYSGDANDDAAEPSDADSGSGTIVWDAALHLVEYFQSINYQPKGSIIDISAGTGVLGLAVEKMIANHTAASSSSSSTSPSSSSSPSHSPVILTDFGPVLRLLQANVRLNESAAKVLSFQWNDTSSFMDQLSSHLAHHRLPPIRTLLCSELIDTIPSVVNGQQVSNEATLATLVDALTQLAKLSLASQKARDDAPSSSTSSLSSPRACDIWFTFEQRGVFTLGPSGMLDESFIRKMKSNGFDIELIDDGRVYTNQIDATLVLLRMTMKEQQ